MIRLSAMIKHNGFLNHCDTVYYHMLVNTVDEVLNCSTKQASNREELKE